MLCPRHSGENRNPEMRMLPGFLAFAGMMGSRSKPVFRQARPWQANPARTGSRLIST
jgi:hypothetical protein